MSTARPHLQLVPATAEAARPYRWFCGVCGVPSPDGHVPPPFARGCEACGLGILVEAPAELAPVPGDAFLLVDRALAVQALSAAAERLLAVRAEEVIGRPLAELLHGADAEAAEAEPLGAAIARATGGEDEPVRMTVRPAGVFGVRLSLRVGACGPPRAALLVLEQRDGLDSPQCRTGSYGSSPSSRSASSPCRERSCRSISSKRATRR